MCCNEGLSFLQRVTVVANVGARSDFNVQLEPGSVFSNYIVFNG